MVVLSATLSRTTDGTLLSGKTLKFLVDNVQVGTGVTNGSGVATFSYSIPAGAALGAHPLVLVEVWGTGHLDGLVVPAVVGAAWLAVRGRHAAAGALLGAGALVKLYPAALLLLLPIAAWPVALPSFTAVVLAGYAPALLAGTEVLGSLPRYVTEEYFNPGLLRSLMESPAATIASAAVWVAVASTARRHMALPVRAVVLIGGLVLLSPNIFPWYAIWLVPFLAWAPSIPWIAFTGTVVFAYAFFLHLPWGIPAWARALEFAPLALGALWWSVTRLPLARIIPSRRPDGSGTRGGWR
jgi:hypothetical protein